MSAPVTRNEKAAWAGWADLEFEAAIELLATQVGLNGEGTNDGEYDQQITELEKAVEKFDNLDQEQKAEASDEAEEADAAPAQNKEPLPYRELVAQWAAEVDRLRYRIENQPTPPGFRPAKRYLRMRANLLRKQAEAQKELQFHSALATAIDVDSLDDVVAEVDKWLVREAIASKHHVLVNEGGYMSLSSAQKVMVFKNAGVTELDVNNPASFKKLSSKHLIKRSSEIDWSRFSHEVRALKGSTVVTGAEGAQARAGLNDKSPGRNGATAGNLAFGSQAGAGVGEISVSDSQRMNVGFVGIPALGILGKVLASVEQWKNAREVGAGAGDAASAAAPEGLEAFRKAADMAKIAIVNLGAAGDAAAATAASSSLSIVAGVCLMARGLFEIHKAQDQLGQLKAIAAEGESSIPGLETALGSARLSAELNRLMGAGKAFSGAASTAAGSLAIVFGVSNPIGWSVLAGAALVGGVFTLVKMYQDRQDKIALFEECARTKGVKPKEAGNLAPTPDWRNEELQRMGFNTVDQWFESEMRSGAALLFYHGVSNPVPGNDETEQAQKILTALGLTIDAGTQPSAEVIYKKLCHGG